MPTYQGGCHCGRIRFEVEGDLERVGDCNCSICSRVSYLHWRIEPEQLRMLTPWENLSVYVWGTGRARHYFCPTCGVAPLRNPRGDPSKISVNARCLEGVDVESLVKVPIDGRSLKLPETARLNR